ncbi:MAG: hypothetical protein OHK0023_25340 [Anaerolineae bacterium]
MLARMMPRFSPFALFALRLVIGFTFMATGLSKFQNLQSTELFFGSLGLPVPGVLALVVAVVEAVGGFLVVIGLLTRYMNVLHIIVLIVAIITVKLNTGFVPGGAPGVGFELDLLMMTGSFVLLTFGSGALSVEGNVLRREF